ncbi:hypothetical protein [Pantoea ananatis]|uniref:hypothetical protein n=1 Tax=Pantoea ananas TaxID=553 RepID=UPI001C8A246F|nr:hypothetical protein [Pantoea ananatis]QZE28250.1 hypothetical protein K4732_15155 [Pantoea ananatis]
MENRVSPSQWVTVQDCLGIPGFPGTPANVRKKLDSLASGNPGKKRKREGTKASEYHTSLLPDISKEYFKIPKLTPTHEVAKAKPSENEFWWEAIYKALSEDELDLIISAFKNNGKSGVFTEKLLTATESEISGVPRTALNTALALLALPDAERKEILEKYNIAEQGESVAPREELHKRIS